MSQPLEPLMNDGFDGEPAKRVLKYEEIIPLLETLLTKLENRVADRTYFGRPDSPRVLITGCPIGGDAAKIFRIIEEAGGVVVALDACTGMKAFTGDIEENTSDPISAIAARYMKIPCACMTPNEGRLRSLSDMIERFKPDAVVDFILQSCHAYNIESYKIGNHVIENHGLPFLKVESDYSDGDIEQLRTRVEALFETI